MLMLTLALLFLGDAESAGILYPRLTETREIISLNGIWNFRVANPTNIFEGHEKKWYENDRKLMADPTWQPIPVPSSYNDLVTETALRDYVGFMWYQRNFFVPNTWQGQRVWLRFAAVRHRADVWINGNRTVTQLFGHLPFQADITSVVKFGAENNLTLALDNRLLETTIPQGVVVELPNGRLKQTFTFDFFNYAGIDHPVVLYTTPETYIDDVTVSTSNDGTDGVVSYSLDIEGSDNVTARGTLLDKAGQAINSAIGINGSIDVPNANLWWPYLMDPNPGYLYTLVLELLNDNGDVVDSYNLPVGIRTISWDNKSVKINDKPIYFRGVDRHEDSEIRGKGLDLSVVIRDYSLLQWLGANAYRTSHYPYAEEIMDMADQLGIMILDESPAINTENFTDTLLESHKSALTQLIQRDKNRPGVVIWSAANEPRTQYPESEDYYRQIIAHIKSLDTSRPVTVINNQLPDEEYSGQFLDIACCNVYIGWYNNYGDWDTVISLVKNVTTRWNEVHDIPVMMTEFGADTTSGFHSLPSYPWSEEYQVDFYSHYFQAFDEMREEGFFIGELAWNFADFKTAVNRKRNKGLFTRDRQPKASAKLIRKRYWALAEALENAEAPSDLGDYIFDGQRSKDEL